MRGQGAKLDQHKAASCRIQIIPPSVELLTLVVLLLNQHLGKYERIIVRGGR